MMEARRRCLFYIDHGDDEIGVFYKAPNTYTSKFTKDDGEDTRDNGDIIVYQQ